MGQAETAATAAASEGGTLRGQFYDLSFSVHKSRRYHQRLVGFYGAWRDAARIVTAVSGSGLFLLVTSDAPGTVLVSALVALWGVLDIILSPDKKADLHRTLCVRFTALAREVDTAARDEPEYRRLLAERLTIEESEPPCKRLVDLQARNDECRARDFPPEELVPLSRAQRRFGYFITFGMERLEAWKAERQRLAAAS